MLQFVGFYYLLVRVIRTTCRQYMAKCSYRTHSRRFHHQTSQEKIFQSALTPNLSPSLAMTQICFIVATLCSITANAADVFRTLLAEEFEASGASGQAGMARSLSAITPGSMGRYDWMHRSKLLASAENSRRRVSAGAKAVARRAILPCSSLEASSAPASWHRLMESLSS